MHVDTSSAAEAVEILPFVGGSARTGSLALPDDRLTVEHRDAPGFAAADLRMVDCFDVPLLAGSFERACEWLVGQARRPPDSTTVAMHMNVFNYYLLAREATSGRALRAQCTFIFDGIGMKLGARILGSGWLPDLNGTDLFPLVMRRAADENLPVFFVGGTESIVEQAVQVVRAEYPTLTLAGWHSGYFTREQEPEIVARIQRSGASMLLVGRGPLDRDSFVLRHRNEFGVPLVWNVGGLFDFVSGRRPRAPLALRRLRLEWVFRFCLDPRGKWKRNVVAAPWFIAHTIRRRLQYALWN